MISEFQSFWDGKPAHSAASDQLVREAESALGVPLPPEFVSLAKVQNGRYTKGFVHPMTQRTSWAPDHVPLPWMAGISVANNSGVSMNIMQAEYLSNEWGLPPKQVLISGEVAFWLTLDYRAGSVPSVAWIDVDCAEDLQVSPSFAAFLAGLVPESMFT